MMTLREAALVKKYARCFPSRTASQIADDTRLPLTAYLAAIVADVRAEQARAG